MHAGQGRPIPLIALIGAALAGAVALAFAPVLPAPIVLPVAMLVLAAARVLCGRLAIAPTQLCRVLVLLLAVLLGAMRVQIDAQHVLETRLPAHFDGVEAEIEGRLLGLPERGRDGLVALFLVERVLAGPEGLATRLEGQRIELRWFRGGGAVMAGTRWQLGVRLRPPAASTGPGRADPARRAAVEGWVASAQIRDAVPALDLGAASGPRAGLDRWREARATAIHAALGNHGARYVRALSIGDTRGLTDADWTLLRRFGLTHLIAISGFHVAMVALLGVLAVRGGWWLWPALARRWPRPMAAAWGGFAVALVYAGVAGFSLPTVRTVLMIAVVALARSTSHSTAPLQPLALAVGVVLLVDPLAVLTPGFWLSCGGVLLLVWGCEAGRNRIGAGFLRAQWVASLGLIPVLAVAFLAVPAFGPLANLLAIPWVSLVVVPLSVLGLLLEPFAAPAAAFAWSAAAIAMDGFERGLLAVPEAFAPLWSTGRPGMLTLALAVIGIGWLLLPRGVPLRPLGLLLVLPLFWSAPSRPAPGELEIKVFDLPRGDAVLLRTARHDLLIDTGPAGTGLVDALRAEGLHRLDQIILSRGNAGRAGGLPEVRAAWPEAGIWWPPGAGDTPRTQTGLRWSGSGLRLDVLHPHADFPTGDAEASAVLRVTGAFGEVLLVGDSGRWIARRIAMDGAAPRLLLGAPAVLADWQTVFPAAMGVATRRPGPALALRWPAGSAHPGQAGRLHLRLPVGGGEVQLDAWRAAPRRWWDGVPARPAML